MARPPVLSGELPEGGAIELLREIESKRITGALRFESGAMSGEIVLYGGEIAVDQAPREDGKDPVDVFLELGPGRYEVHQRLPPLSVSRGDDYTKRGSLAVHVPADLMSYCEHAGLSGTLELRHRGHKAEAIYDAGELLVIELDGNGEADLSEVFGWEEGKFEITLDPVVSAQVREDEAPTLERPAVPRRREDTRQFLRVVEMALVDVVQESERARSPTRTSPPLPPPPKARPRPEPVPPPKRRSDEQTVRLIYLGGEPPEVQDDASTRHVSKGEAELALTEAQPERRAALAEPAAMADEETKDEAADTEETREEETSSAGEAEASEGDAEKEAPAKSDAANEGDAEKEAAAAKSDAANENDAPAVRPAVALAGAVGWAVGFLLIAIVILAVLAHLPPVQ